jgi:hypothetical protein
MNKSVPGVAIASASLSGLSSPKTGLPKSSAPATKPNISRSPISMWP